MKTVYIDETGMKSVFIQGDEITNIDARLRERLLMPQYHIHVF